MDTYSLKLHYYSASTDPAEYRALRNRMLADGVKVWQTIEGFLTDDVGAGYWEKIRETREVEIETDHLFSNQWNTTSGLRVFRWHERYKRDATGRCVHGPMIEGYWIEFTPEFRALLDNMHVCGYCGKQEPAAKGYVFCPHCLDSEYLKVQDLLLTRMRPVSAGSGYTSPELSDAERAHLVPLYHEAQKRGATERGKVRLARQRENIERRYANTVHEAAIERDSARWIMDHCPQLLSEHIYYSHTDRHCFGWRKPLAADDVSQLLDVISEFPWSYTIKCADGRVLEN
jgi:hypothetical protein